MRATTDPGQDGGSAPVELIRALAAYLEPPGPEHAGLASALGLGAPPSGADHAETFLLHMHPYASVHLGPEGMLGGPARERIVGFWRALGRTPPKEPDHLAVLLGLYAALWDERAEAEPAEREIVESAAGALLWEHVASWVFEPLGELAREGGAYAGWAVLLSDVIRAEAVAFGVPARLPAHLAEAPGLPDPRDEGGAAFLDGLLAPVRTGFVLTRRSLAGVARAHGLGLRAGERRYALSHLLGQAPAEVMRSLAEQAEAALGRHEERVADLGPVARFGADRARASAALLRELSTEGARLLEEASGVPS